MRAILICLVGLWSAVYALKLEVSDEVPGRSLALQTAQRYTARLKKEQPRRYNEIQSLRIQVSQSGTPEIVLIRRINFASSTYAQQKDSPICYGAYYFAGEALDDMTLIGTLSQLLWETARDAKKNLSFWFQPTDLYVVHTRANSTYSLVYWGARRGELINQMWVMEAGTLYDVGIGYRGRVQIQPFSPTGKMLLSFLNIKCG